MAILELSGVNVPVKLKLQLPPPPGHLNFWRLACSNSLPSGQKSRSNTPPISTEIPLLKEKFCLQSNTVHAFQREICRDDTLKLLLKTVLGALFTNKGEILSWKSVKPCKNRKNSQAYFARTRDKSGSNSPPFQGNVQIPRFTKLHVWPVHNCMTWLIKPATVCTPVGCFTTTGVSKAWIPLELAM